MSGSLNHIVGRDGHYTMGYIENLGDAMLHARLIWRGVNDEVVRHKRNGAPNDTRQMP